MKGRLFSIYCTKCNEAPHALEEPDGMKVLEDGLVYVEQPVGEDSILVLDAIRYALGCGCDEGMPHRWVVRNMSSIAPVNDTLTIDHTYEDSKPNMHSCYSCRKPIDVDKDKSHDIRDGWDIVCHECWEERKEDKGYINPAIERY